MQIRKVKSPTAEIENDLTLSFMDEYNVIQTPKRDKRLGTILALSAGICSMVPQNGLIVTFDFFQAKFVDFNVYFYMVIPIAIGMTIMSFLIYPLSSKLKIYDRIYIGNGACFILLPLLPIIAIYSPNALGFWICMTIIFFLGFAVQLIIAGGISFTSAFPKENYTTQLFSGFAFSGIICTILRIILLSIFGTAPKAITVAIMIFFCIFGLAFLALMKIIHLFSQTEYSTIHLEKIEGKLISNIEKLPQLEMTEFGQFMLDNDGKSTTGVSRLTDLNQLSDIGEDELKFPMQVKLEEKQSSPSISGNQFFKQVLDQIWPIPLFIIIQQIQTNIMYPGFAISKIEIDGISVSWKTTSIALTWTIADLLGRVFTPYLPQSEFVANQVIKSRYLNCLFFVILVQAWFPMLLRYLIYLNIFIFAFTNGWSLTLSMIVGAVKANVEQKETSSAILGVSINIGIIVGMVSALLLI